MFISVAFKGVLKVKCKKTFTNAFDFNFSLKIPNVMINAHDLEGL
jgi:hypothetical protein